MVCIDHNLPLHYQLLTRCNKRFIKELEHTCTLYVLKEGVVKLVVAEYI